MPHHALKAYGQSALEAEVSAASPHRLIAMLYEGALRAIALAKMYLLNKEIGNKCEAISRAIAIVENGLHASLNFEKGGELSRNLALLYEYVARRLVMANAFNDPAILDEVANILGELSSAWEQIAPVQGESEEEPSR